MKKKLGFIAFMSVFLLSVCAFHYEGTQSRVAATQDKVIPSNENQQLISNVSGEESSKKVEQGKNKQTEEIIKNEDNGSEAKAEDTSKGQKSDSSGSSSDTSQPEKAEEAQDKVKIGDQEFVNIMDREKFAYLANIAKKNNAILYAVPNSDVFTIVKDGKQIFDMSTGIASTPVEYSDMLKELFNQEGFQEYKGINENIHLVMETGAKVTVEFEEYIGYAIYMKNGRIVISW